METPRYAVFWNDVTVSFPVINTARTVLRGTVCQLVGVSYDFATKQSNFMVMLQDGSMPIPVSPEHLLLIGRHTAESLFQGFEKDGQGNVLIPVDLRIPSTGSE